MATQLTRHGCLLVKHGLVTRRLWPMAILFAASYPERIRALILYGAYAKRLDPDADYPWAPTREARAALSALRFSSNIFAHA